MMDGGTPSLARDAGAGGERNGWHHTSTGERRGYIQAQRLKEVWFHTGTACNLACPFCLEGSKPGDTRLGLMKLADVRPFVDEAVALGAEQCSFTGGEPFVARDIIKILHYAADRLPCLVLTNGTLPLIRRMRDIKSLRGSKHPVRFRVSLDHHTAEKHDAGRGPGAFASAIEGIKALLTAGFDVSIARQMEKGEDSAAADRRYTALLGNIGFDRAPTIVAFPDFQPPFSAAETPEITESCMTTYHTEHSRSDFMCSFSRMVVKDEGKMRVYACTLVDDDKRYDLGDTLTASLEPRIMMTHHRCYSCFAFGASCSET